MCICLEHNIQYHLYTHINVQCIDKNTIDVGVLSVCIILCAYPVVEIYIDIHVPI